MPNIDDLPQVAACAIRVAVLDPSGVPNPGANQLYTSSALTELQVTPVYEDGDEITQKNACGTVCVDYKGDDSFRRADVSITVCTHDPYLMAMLGSGDVIDAGAVDGFAFPAIGVLNASPVSIEVWAKRIDDGDLHAEYPYAWWVLPKVRSLRLGQKTFNNGASLPVFTGQALENPNWYDGPLNDWPATSDRVAQWVPVAALPAITGLSTLAAS